MSGPDYVRADAKLPYCRGCGHGLVIRALGTALRQLRIPPADLAIVTDIGCVGLADAYFESPHTIHTTHGRSAAFASGLALSESVLGSARLKPIVMLGDGGATIGLNHLVGGALLNPDVTVLVHNNFLFGMTGGQSSAFSPLDFVTSTTRSGNQVPPLDLARVLIASRAPFVARKLAGDRDLAEVLARAIDHPGFAVVEILELCTAYATRWNEVTGSRLKVLAAEAGYELGVLHDKRRPTYGESFRRHVASIGPGMAAGAGEAGEVEPRQEPAGGREGERSVARDGTPPGGGREEGGPHPPRRFTANVDRPIGIVLAGTAGERVQTAASILGRAAILCGLRVTQKNDNPVTQGSGFSVSEVILSPEEILYTGLESPDVLLVVSPDGASELRRTGMLSRVSARSRVLVDETIDLPDLPCAVDRRSFRSGAGAKLAALAAVAAWLRKSRALPEDAFWSALRGRLPDQSDAIRKSLENVPSEADRLSP